jgi:hypothetical protein
MDGGDCTVINPTYKTEVRHVVMPLDVAERVVRFLNLSAGEGLCFEHNREYDTLDAASILMEWFGDEMETWVPEDVRKEWNGEGL